MSFIIPNSSSSSINTTIKSKTRSQFPSNHNPVSTQFTLNSNIKMSTSSLFNDHTLTNQLNQIRAQLNKKQTFESSVISLKSLLLDSYPSSSPPTKKLFYDVVSRVVAVIRARYTAPGFLLVGVDLLETAEHLFNDPNEVSHLSSSAAALRQSLHLDDEERVPPQQQLGSGYLFEGHLTVDREPGQPNWLIQQHLLTDLAARDSAIHSDTGGADNNGDLGVMFRGLVESMGLEVSMEGWEDLLPADVASRRAAPPASKKVVEKLPVVKVNDSVLMKVGEDIECSICKEKLGVGDEMQEMPCKHLFHPLCLKPWLDNHNSCPICRHELPTDDHKYESWKEREKELEEERRGAANAVREGEFMYI